MQTGNEPTIIICLGTGNESTTIHVWGLGMSLLQYMSGDWE